MTARTFALLTVLTVACSGSTKDVKTTDAGPSDGATPTPSPTPTPTPTPRWRSAVGAGGVFLQTFDERAWESRIVAPHDLYAVACVGNLVGWASGPSGAVLHTNDGGRTWASQDTHLSASLRAIRFGAGGFGVVAGEHGALATSSDNGASWSPAGAQHAGDVTLRGVVVVGSSGLAIVVGDGGVVLRTNDSGRTFERSPIAGAADLHAIASDDGAHLLLAVDAAGGIWASTNRGASFEREAKAPSALHGVSLDPRGTHALAVGDDGIALVRSATGTWTSIVTGTHASLRAALVSEDGSIDYAAGDRGTLLAKPAGGPFGALALPTPTTADLFALEDL